MENQNLPEKKQIKNKKISKNLSIILFILAILYNVSPIDFIMDITPIIGLTDDFILTIAALINLYLKWRKK